MILVIAPMMLVGGGNEEVGWRMILQPELEKKFGFNLATILTGITWWLWHFPIFFIKGTANINMNYFLFGIMCLTLSYALATIRKTSKGVFPCILTHCVILLCFLNNRKFFAINSKSIIKGSYLTLYLVIPNK